MAQVSTNPVKFIASGLLSVQKGPGGVGWAQNSSPNADVPVSPKKYRIQGIKVLKIGASGSVEVFDDKSGNPAPADSVFASDITETVTNLGINCKSGDIYVRITGGYVAYLYLDQNN